jgi:DNA repair protein RadB
VEPGSTVTLFFGEAGTGKTNICLQVASNVAATGKKVIYIDTEGVSLERLQQMAGEKYEDVMKNILFFEPHSFDEQEKFVDKAVKLAESSLESASSSRLCDHTLQTDEDDEERGVQVPQPQWRSCSGSREQGHPRRLHHRSTPT